MPDFIAGFRTFNEFLEWFNAPETDGINGKSEQLRQKQQFKRSMYDVLFKLVPGNSPSERKAAIGKMTEEVPYDERLRIVWETYYGDSATTDKPEWWVF